MLGAERRSQLPAKYDQMSIMAAVTNAALIAIGSIFSSKRWAHPSRDFRFRGSGRLVGICGHPGSMFKAPCFGYVSMLCIVTKFLLLSRQPPREGELPRDWNPTADGPSMREKRGNARRPTSLLVGSVLTFSLSKRR